MAFSSVHTEDPLIQRAIKEQVNQALSRGALYAAMMAIAGVVGVGGALLTTGDAIWRPPFLFSIFAMAYTLLLWQAGRRQRLEGTLAYLLIGIFATVPTGYFLIAEWVTLGGMASYITGTISYTYFIVIGLAGFLLSFRVALLAGLVAAAGYLLCFFIAQPSLQQIQTDNPILHEILSSSFVAGMKALVMVCMGVVTGGIGIVSRRLLLRTIEEERQKDRVQRLFGQYVSGVVSERILERAAESRGERVEVVVLFSDLRGFSTFAEGRDPADVVDRLNAYFERMVAAIESEGGVIDKFIGDAVMAVFGGLITLESPCDSAVRAAIKMREALDRLNADWETEGLERFENGIGLHVGDVLQGPIGSANRKEFTAIGDAVNTAARLEAATKLHDTPILLTRAVYKRLSKAEKERFRPLGEVTVKGKQEHLVVYGLRHEHDD